MDTARSANLTWNGYSSRSRSLPTPPEIPTTDPEREKKLRKWQEKNKKPFLSVNVFTKDQHLALLGASRRRQDSSLEALAVAYANPARRRISEDALPPFDSHLYSFGVASGGTHIAAPNSHSSPKNCRDITGQLP